MKKTIIFCAILAIVSILSPVAFAQFVPAPVDVSGEPITLGEIDSTIRLIATFLIVISIVIAIIAIVWSGITYMTAGSDNTKVVLARQRLFSAIIGALIVLAVGVILNTVAGLVSRDFFFN